MNRNRLHWVVLPALMVGACGVESPNEVPAGNLIPAAEVPPSTLPALAEHVPVEPVLRDNVTVISPRIAQHFGILPNQLRIPVAGHEQLLLAEPGHVVSSRYLFFRKVTAVRRDGPMIVLDTVEAKLTDAVLQGTFDLEVVGTVDPDTNVISFYDEADDPFVQHADVVEEETPFGQGQFQLSYEYDKTFLNNNINLVAAAGLDFPNRWYNLTGSGSLRVMPILKADFKPSIRVQGKVSCCENWSLSNPFSSLDPKIDYARVIAKGTLTAEAGFEVKATVASQGELDVLIIGQQGALKNIPCYQLSGSIGILPVTARVCPSMRFKGSYDVEGQADFLAKVEMSRTVEARVGYESGSGWGYDFDVGSFDTKPTVQREVQFALTATATLTPRLEADISGVLGGSVQIDATATFASNCVAPNMHHSLSAAVGGKADAFMGPISLPIIGTIAQKNYEWTLFQRNYPNLWSSDFGTCVPSYATLNYNEVPADPNDQDGLSLELDFAIEVPAAEARDGGIVSHSPDLRTVPAAPDQFPYVRFGGADAPGQPERVEFTRFLDGQYKIWVHDYENDLADRNIASFARSGARVSMWLGNGQLRNFTAPGGVGNKWNVANFTRAANGATNITAVNTLETVDLIP